MAAYSLRLQVICVLPTGEAKHFPCASPQSPNKIRTDSGPDRFTEEYYHDSHDRGSTDFLVPVVHAFNGSSNGCHVSHPVHDLESQRPFTFGYSAITATTIVT
ncbi:hypothetical protein K449DRAFT_397542 [Hypoxylon sp. EC38]|nr:hypothetical protein K449DRAFT_397542 [Hypoxylon sp. EC38]